MTGLSTFVARCQDNDADQIRVHTGGLGRKLLQIDLDTEGGETFVRLNRPAAERLRDWLNVALERIDE